MGGAETYCFLCGGPLTNSGEVITDIPTLKKAIAAVKKTKRSARTKAMVEVIHHIENFFYEIEEDDRIKVASSDITKLKRSIKKISSFPKYKWLNKSVILEKSGQVTPVTTHDSWEREFKGRSGKMYIASFMYNHETTKKIDPMYDPTSSKFFGDGYVMHQDCYAVTKSKYGNFTFDNIRFAKMNHGMIKKYQGQEVLWQQFFLDQKTYLLESPLKNSTNKARILKIKHPIKKGQITTQPTRPRKSKKTSRKRSKKTSRKRSKKTSRKTSRKKTSRKTSRRKSYSRATRPSPSHSATLFRPGEVRLGNDGNQWKIVVNKNGVKRWQKLR